MLNQIYIHYINTLFVLESFIISCWLLKGKKIGIGIGIGQFARKKSVSESATKNHDRCITSSWVVCYFSERYTIWSWGECAETSTLGRIGVWFECLPLVNNLPHYGMMDFKWFGNYSSQIDGSNNGFSKIFADFLPPWHCINTPEDCQNFCFYRGAHTSQRPDCCLHHSFLC